MHKSSDAYMVGAISTGLQTEPSTGLHWSKTITAAVAGSIFKDLPRFDDPQRGNASFVSPLLKNECGWPFSIRLPRKRARTSRSWTMPLDEPAGIADDCIVDAKSSI